MSLGTQLQTARKQAGSTQQQIADALHVTRQTISSWETGHSYPDLASLVALSDRFNVSLDSLIKGDQLLQEDAKRQAKLLKRVRHFGWVVLASDLVLLIALLGNLSHWPDFEIGLWPVVLIDIIVFMNLFLVLALARWQHQLRRLPKIAPWLRNLFIFVFVAIFAGGFIIHTAHLSSAWEIGLFIVVWLIAVAILFHRTRKQKLGK